ncbi:MAG: hypothetical protein H7122_05725 [Chitinophagaceae bacterium]|nr:hypothetical protein [Chitinophagaceae bacterium]
MKYKRFILILFSMMWSFSYGQSFIGLYSIGKSTFRAKSLSEQDQRDGLFNIVYTKGSKAGTMASGSENPKFEFVFDEHEGDIYLGTFYFTKAWKGKPLEGYYVRAKDKKKIKVKFLKE